MARVTVDLTGRVFGRLTVLSRGKPVYGKPGWLCECTCGTVVNVFGSSLKAGHRLSCGCLTKELHGLRNLKHGMTKSPEYKAWVNMRSRCTNEKDERFLRYGARGIMVCPQWMNSFEAFLAEVGPRPGPEYSIDRINNTGDYEPGNCKWSTRKEQCRNKNDNHIIIYHGSPITIAELAEQSELPYYKVYNRIVDLRWSPEAAVANKAEVGTSMIH